MISQRTAEGVFQALDDWRKANGLLWIDIDSLVAKLEKVEGNKSYRDTIAALRARTERRRG